MMVYTKVPRQRTFRKFATAKSAATWVKSNAEKFISIRYAHGFVIVNHFAR